MNNNIKRPHNAKLLNSAIIFAILGVLFYKHTALYLPTGPIYFYDELLYKENAVHIFNKEVFQAAHYPPLYSLVISAALYFDYWFDAIVFINGILSTMLIIPIWLIARLYLVPQMALFVVLLTVLLPYHAIYPNLVLSENLFLSIFAFAVFFALKGADCKKVASVFFGILLALGYLTRHLMLPAIPVLIACWLLVPIFYKRDPRFCFKRNFLFLNIGCVALGFVVTYSPWIFFAKASGLAVYEAMGFHVSGLKANVLTVQSLVMWSSAYAAYIVVVVAAYIMPLSVIAINALNRKYLFSIPKNEHSFYILLVVLTAIYWALASQHSFGASYNYPTPKYLIGRYLMFLTPLYLVAGILAINEIVKVRSAKNSTLLLSSIGALFTVYIAREVLYGQLIWKFPLWFANLPFNTPDSFAYSDITNMLFASFSIATCGFLIWYTQQKPSHKRILILTIFGTILVWQMLLFVNSIERIKKHNIGLHPRNISKFLKNNEHIRENTLPIYYELPGLTPVTFSLALEFWGYAFKSSNLREVRNTDNPTRKDIPYYYITNSDYTWPVVFEYKVAEKQYYIYRIDPKLDSIDLKIINYGPNKLAFTNSRIANNEPTRTMWFSTLGATKATAVYIEGVKLSTAVKGTTLVSATIPQEVMEKPGLYRAILKDSFLGMTSEPVIIEIYETTKELKQAKRSPKS